MSIKKILIAFMFINLSAHSASESAPAADEREIISIPISKIVELLNKSDLEMRDGEIKRDIIVDEENYEVTINLCPQTYSGKIFSPYHNPAISGVKLDPVIFQSLEEIMDTLKLYYGHDYKRENFIFRKAKNNPYSVSHTTTYALVDSESEKPIAGYSKIFYSVHTYLLMDNRSDLENEKGLTQEGAKLLESLQGYTLLALNLKVKPSRMHPVIMLPDDSSIFTDESALPAGGAGAGAGAGASSGSTAT